MMLSTTFSQHLRQSSFLVFHGAFSLCVVSFLVFVVVFFVAFLFLFVLICFFVFLPAFPDSISSEGVICDVLRRVLCARPLRPPSHSCSEVVHVQASVRVDELRCVLNSLCVALGRQRRQLLQVHARYRHARKHAHLAVIFVGLADGGQHGTVRLSGEGVEPAGRLEVLVRVLRREHPHLLLRCGHLRGHAAVPLLAKPLVPHNRLQKLVRANAVEGKPFLRVFFEHAEDEVLGVLPDVRQEIGHAVLDFSVRLLGVAAFEGGAPVDELVEENPQRPRVYVLAVRRLVYHFWGQVVERAAEGGSLLRGLSQVHGPAEVAHFQCVSQPQQDVFWFYVAVDDVLGVNVRYCVHHLREVPGGAGLAKPAPLLKQLEQLPAWRQLENEVNPLRVMEPIIQSQYVWMAEVRLYLDFALQLFLDAVLHQLLLVQNLQSANVLGKSFARDVDGAELAAAEVLAHLEVGYFEYLFRQVAGGEIGGGYVDHGTGCTSAPTVRRRHLRPARSAHLAPLALYRVHIFVVPGSRRLTRLVRCH
mmetsp:Transcript_470/g.967  ORF Transcript_470/g.967 Transcript_470/m.967 type:complete len:531 (+) Transcript_470:485-2077(+)